MPKLIEYNWGELKIKVEEAPVFDTKNNKYIAGFGTARVEKIDFKKLTNKVIKNNPEVQIPFIITFPKKW